MQRVFVRRIPQFVLVASAVVLSWLWMQAIHELGHVLHAYFTGGEVQRVVLHPLTISFTDVRPNPQPLAVAWGGPLWGCLIPIGLWCCARLASPKQAWLLQFFAGFCLIANGVYLAAAAWQPVGDAKTLHDLGTSTWSMFVVGAIATVAGLWCWNGLGPRFGWKQPHGDVDTRVAWSLAMLLLLTIAVELLLAPI